MKNISKLNLTKEQKSSFVNQTVFRPNQLCKTDKLRFNQQS